MFPDGYFPLSPLESKHGLGIKNGRRALAMGTIKDANDIVQFYEEQAHRHLDQWRSDELARAGIVIVIHESTRRHD